MQLSGKTAALIGGGDGIGRELAFALAREGVSLSIGDVDVQAAAATANMAGICTGVHWAECDIGSDSSVKDFADSTFNAFGRVDLLFNHAGVSLGGALEKISSDDWRWLLDHNVVGLGRSISAFLPRMAASGGGWIVNTSSGLGLFHDMAAAAPYIASKAAIIGYSRALALYTREMQVGVSVFCPDLTDTAFPASSRVVGLLKAVAADDMPVERIQSASEAAACLIAGLRSEKFLISAVPNTSERLIAMARAMLEPGSDDVVEASIGSIERMPVAQAAAV